MAKEYDRSELESLDKSTLITLFLLLQDQMTEMNSKIDRLTNC